MDNNWYIIGISLEVQQGIPILENGYIFQYWQTKAEIPMMDIHWYT